jgi:hypothetical protein
LTKRATVSAYLRQTLTLIQVGARSSPCAFLPLLTATTAADTHPNAFTHTFTNAHVYAESHCGRVRFSPDILPPPDIDAESCPTGVSGRLQCSEQVYDQYLTDFQVANERQPTLRDIIATLYHKEFGGMTDPVLKEALGNNFLNSCGETGCTREELILWLSSKQGWYSYGRQNNLAHTGPLISYPNQQDYEVLAEQIVGIGTSWPAACSINVNIPCDWANWGLQDADYSSIRNRSVSTLYCILYQYWFDEGNPPDDIPNRPPDIWGDYIFAVVSYDQDSQLGDPSTYDYSVTPGWLNDQEKRVSRKNRYSTDVSCTSLD